MNILNLPDYAVHKVEENETDYLITATYIPEPPFCMRCGQIAARLYRHGVRHQRYMDIPLHGKRTGVMVIQQRWRCRECGKSFIEDLPEMDDHFSMTRRLVRYIATKAMEGIFTNVADDVGIDEKTVRTIFKAWVRFQESQPDVNKVTPRCLGIDELHMGGSARCVLTNVEENTVIDFLRDRNKPTVVNRLLDFTGREAIEVVCIDMWKPYRDAVNTVLPQAVVVVDKFHVVRMANEALDTVRKALKSNMTDRERRRLMHDRHILLRRRFDLNDKDRLLLDTWTSNLPDLKVAYELKEAFYDIWNAPDRQTARTELNDWRARARTAAAYQPLLTSLSNWEAEILAYFDQPVRITNAYTESLNGLARLVNRNGRGYSFAVMRAKILYGNGLRKLKRASFRGNWDLFVASPNQEPIDDVADDEYEGVWDDFGVDVSTLVEIIETHGISALSTVISE